MDTTRVDLTPKPGFCVKTSALQSAVCRVTGQSLLAPVDKPANAIAPVPGTLVIPQGMKVFVNVAWDANVPPPLEGNEEAIQRAMAGEDEIDEDAIARGDLWFVPVVVSEPRSDTDKGEPPCPLNDQGGRQNDRKGHTVDEYPTRMRMSHPQRCVPSSTPSSHHWASSRPMKGFPC